MDRPQSSANDGSAPGSPGHALYKLFMQPLGLTAYRLSVDLGMAPIAVSQILRGKRAISPSTALKLGAYFGVDPAFWLVLQAAHDLQVAAQAQAVDGAVEGALRAVKRCPALAGRSLVVRESNHNGAKQWEVLMVSSKDAAPLGDKRPGLEPKAAKSKKNNRPTAAKRKAKAFSKR